MAAEPQAPGGAQARLRSQRVRPLLVDIDRKRDYPLIETVAHDRTEVPTMAEIRMGPELGMPYVNRGELKHAERPVSHREVPGRDLNNKQFDELTRQMTAVSAGQTQNVYKVTGGTIDFQA